MLVDDAFYSELLTYLGAPVTEENLQFCETWQRREGGNAKWNPFNTTWIRPGSTDYNSVGVQNYPSSSVGVEATGKTLKMSVYANLVAAFKSGNPWANPGAYANALRTWSGGGYTSLVRPSSPTPNPVPLPPGDLMPYLIRTPDGEIDLVIGAALIHLSPVESENPAYAHLVTYPIGQDEGNRARAKFRV